VRAYLATWWYPRMDRKRPVESGFLAERGRSPAHGRLRPKATAHHSVGVALVRPHMAPVALGRAQAREAGTLRMRGPDRRTLREQPLRNPSGNTGQGA
jgi:hypothetical protein